MAAVIWIADNIAAPISLIAEGAAQARDAANNGSVIVEETLRGMQTIKQKVDLSGLKVQEMGKRSDQIGDTPLLVTMMQFLQPFAVIFLFFQ